MAELIGAVAGVVSAVLEAGKCLAAPIGRQFMYLYNYKKNIDNLQGEVTKLKNTRDEVQVKATAAERNLEEIKQNVKDWQSKVNNAIIEAEKLIQEKENNPRCFKGLCPNLKTRYIHGKKAFKLKRDDIGPLLLQEEKFDRVSYPTTQPEIRFRSNEDYLAFESRISTEKKIRDALNDENIYMMGVYGMGGLGKTTLVEEVGRKVEKDKLFEEIVFVEVTETPDIKKIQTTIANKLGLKFENEKDDESERANKLYARMEKKNILLILDNIWKELDLKMVGIPSGADRGRNKILMTTRNVDVLEKMGSTNNFGMGILNEQEAWNLFQKMAGTIIHTRELNSLPNDVCKECGGLPIVICTIAKALRNRRQESQWKDALRELRKPSPAKFTRILEKEYSKIKLSYDYLDDDELKKTFIISSLMENDTSISYLLRNIFSLGILRGVNLKIEEARDRLDLVVKELKDSCLLLDGTIKERFSMHDVVRVVALTCGYTYHHVFTEKNDIEREWKDKDQLRKCTIISLVGNDIITQLWPEGLDCPELEFFDMSRGVHSFKIPDEFFTMMPKLRVLNSFRILQFSLPSSLDLLTNLQTLCLDYSNIEDIAIIGKLKKLKVLSLQSCSCKVLTTEIGQLTQLRLLDLSNCWRLGVIAPNVISKLSQLEELYIQGCSVEWKVEELEELKGLSHLTSLELDIKDNKMLPKCFFSKELKRYNISIGDCPYTDLSIKKDETLRMLQFQFNSTISLEELQRIKNVEILFLAANDENSLDQLQFNITPFFNEKLIFTNLMILKLHNITSGKIWDNQLPTLMSSSYKNLTQLTLKRCRNIKYVFPSSIAKSLMQLQQLRIMHCTALEEIVAKEEGANAVVNFVFLNVTILKLVSLPELTTFYPERHTSEWSKLKELVVRDCDKFSSKHMSFQENNEESELHISEPKSIFLDDKLIFTNLMILELHNISSGKIWDNQLPTLMSSSYKNLTQLTLTECRNIKYAFPSPIAKSLMQLQRLKIKECTALEEIVAKEEGANAVVNFVFPNVTILVLENLPELIAFYPERHTSEWPKLKELMVCNCDKFISKLMSFQENSEEGELHISEPKSMFLDDKLIFTNLMILELNNISSGKIWDNQLPTLMSSSYKNLTQLALRRCRNIKYVFPSSIAKSLMQLQELRIEDCKLLEEIVAKEEGANAVVNFVFPNVTKLELEYLPELKAFYTERHTSEWPKLKELVVRDCDKFTSKHMSFQETSEESELHIFEPKSIFLDDKINSDLEEMELRDENIWIDWHNGSKTLEIGGDDLANFPLGLLQRFKNLKKLHLYYNNYKELFLSDLSNLEVLEVSNCNNLMKLITPSTARSLVKLREMRVEQCEMLIEIVENEGDATMPIEIVFNNLKKLSLRDLKSLACFCFENSSFSFPSLEELIIRECPNIKTFSQGILSTPKLHKVIYETWNDTEYEWKKIMEVENEGIDLNKTIQEAYEKQKQVDSNLKKLTLSGRDINSIWEGEFQKNFGEVKTLQLIKDEHANIPIQIFHKFNSLEKLILRMSSYEEIFSCEEDEGHVGALTNLKILELWGLLKLKCISKQGSRLNSILQNLHSLKVNYCHNLMTLLPSSTSFENLTTLKVSYCNRMQNLMSSSIVKSLMRLEELSIKRCEMMIEVFANEGDIEKCEIVFEKLKELYLDNLKSLTCFCSGDYTLKFPFLERLYVRRCSKMKTFSRGRLSMPSLRMLNWTDCSESDIDTIIQQLQNDCSEFCEKIYRKRHS